MWLAVFYVFVSLCILFFLGFVKLVSRSKFRAEDGDITTEVGFEEDAQGNVKKHEYQSPSLNEVEKPHVGIEKVVQ